MRYVKWTLLILVLLFAGAFLHYTLPQRDIVRIVDTDVRRIDFGENSIFWAAPDTGTTTAANRDVRFINVVRPNGKVMVYRNEDTGWGWPPYFKLDSSNLQTEASDLASTKAEPQWVALKHYGWRNEFFTIYPNAVGVKAVSRPDVRLIPYLNIFILVILGFAILMIWRMLAQFRERTIDPLIEDAEDAWDTLDARADQTRQKAKGWLGTWRGKGRK
ncbi:MAG: DUF1523 family protein [Paracoccaceae bacterium]